MVGTISVHFSQTTWRVNIAGIFLDTSLLRGQVRHAIFWGLVRHVRFAAW